LSKRKNEALAIGSKQRGRGKREKTTTTTTENSNKSAMIAATRRTALRLFPTISDGIVIDSRVEGEQLSCESNSPVECMNARYFSF
jgi:hypothetical protein